MDKWLAAAAILAWSLSALGATEVYRWVDKSGTVHYSDTPPADLAVQLRKLGHNLIETDALPYATRQAAEKFPLTLYTADSCQDPCAAARNYLQARKLPFMEKLVQTPEDLAALAKSLGKAAPGAPALQIGAKVLEGFDKSAWNSALEMAGYPAAGGR